MRVGPKLHLERCKFSVSDKACSPSTHLHAIAPGDLPVGCCEIAPNRRNYNHRLMDYSNDPTTALADIQKFFGLLENRIGMRLREEPNSGND